NQSLLRVFAAGGFFCTRSCTSFCSMVHMSSDIARTLTKKGWMEMKKHVLAWGLAVGCLFGSTSVAEAASFSDIGPTDTLKPIVEELNDKGIVSGYPDGTYRPQTKMER